MDKDDSDESSRLLDNERTKSDSNGKSVDIVFDSRMMKTSTQAEDLAATWGGIRSLPDSGRLRRVQSWSGGPPDDGSSEIRILRERLVRTQTMPRPGAVRHLSRRQRLTLASLALVDFMSFCSMSIMAPFFPREASLKGLSDTMCGMVFSFYAVVMFVTSPLFGKFLPKVGAKFLFTAGMFVAGACNVLFGSLVLIEDKTTFTSLCFLVRGLEALGASAYATASYVFVVNAFPDRIGSVLGILETFVGLGMSVGPAIGGLLYSIGGFSLPFYSLGVVMVFTVPINYFLLTDCEEYVYGSKTASIMQLVKIPSIIITGLVIVIMSNTWAFLDPTLEPHLRQFDLSTNQIGLIFLLFSSLYGIFSPIWGWLADRVHNHWCMMVWGLFLSTVGLLLLGPCPYIPGLPGDLWLDLVALSILGMSVALTLLPTFQGVLTSSIYEGGCPEALATYSAVAGLWSCCYSLGEVLGPALGGALSQFYGFPLTATMCAAACFCMAVVTLTFFSLRESSKRVDSIPYTDPTWNSQNFWRNSFFRYFAVVTLTFFSLRESSKWVEPSGSLCDSIPYTDTTWNSQNFCRTRSAPGTRVTDRSPLLTPCSCLSRDGTYGSSPPRHFCLLHNKSNKSGSASVADAIAYFLKFQYMTDMYIKIRRSRLKRKSTRNNEPRKNSDLYQNYLGSETTNTTADKEENLNNNTIPKKSVDNYCDYLDSAIFGSPAVMENVNLDHLVLKRNNSGLMPKLLSCYDDRRPSGEIIRHNLEKVQFYEQSQSCASAVDIFDGCECRDGVTYVKGTITVSSAGACEV